MNARTLNIRNIVVLIACSLAMVWAIPHPVFGQEMATVSNVRFNTTDDYIFIYYDLVPEGEDSLGRIRGNRRIKEPIEYTVAFTLRKESDPEFRFAPKYVGGEIGERIREGKDRVIRWNVAREFSSGIEGTDYYFEVTAKPFTASSNVMSWVIGSGAALVGGTVIYLLFSGPDSPTTGPSGAGTFPPPPGRPQ